MKAFAAIASMVVALAAAPVAMAAQPVTTVAPQSGAGGVKPNPIKQMARQKIEQQLADRAVRSQKRSELARKSAEERGAKALAAPN